jgi:hypothetical protein
MGQSLVREAATESRLLEAVLSVPKPDLISKLLPKRSKKIDKKDERGETALHRAVWMGQGEVLSQLSKKQADASLENDDGLTAFHLALLYGKVDLARIFLDESSTRVSCDSIFGRNPFNLDYSISGMRNVCACESLTCVRDSLLNGIGCFREARKVFVDDNKLLAHRRATIIFRTFHDMWVQMVRCNRMTPRWDAMPLTDAPTCHGFSPLCRKLVVYPRGAKGDENLSLYLEVVDADHLPDNWFVLANFTFAVVSHAPGSKNIVRDGTSTLRCVV